MLSHPNFDGETRVLIPKSCRRTLIQRTSTIVLTINLYSTLVLDRETVGCFLELHETRLDSRNTQYAPVDIISNVVYYTNDILYKK